VTKRPAILEIHAYLNIILKAEWEFSKARKIRILIWDTGTVVYCYHLGENAGLGRVDGGKSKKNAA